MQTNILRIAPLPRLPLSPKARSHRPATPPRRLHPRAQTSVHNSRRSAPINTRTCWPGRRICCSVVDHVPPKSASEDDPFPGSETLSERSPPPVRVLECFVIFSRTIRRTVSEIMSEERTIRVVLIPDNFFHSS